LSGKKASQYQSAGVPIRAVPRLLFWPKISAIGQTHFVVCTEISIFVRVGLAQNHEWGSLKTFVGNL
jgi:hypothetical protein